MQSDCGEAVRLPTLDEVGLVRVEETGANAQWCDSARVARSSLRTVLRAWPVMPAIARTEWLWRRRKRMFIN